MKNKQSESRSAGEHTQQVGSPVTWRTHAAGGLSRDVGSACCRDYI